MDTILLPEIVQSLCRARDSLREYYKSTGLTFTLDGKLVGDIGEVLAAEAFDLDLCVRRTPGVDAITKDKRTVQVKATGSFKRGPAFTPGEGFAEFLIFLRIDFDKGLATVLYNGPEAPIRAMLPPSWKGTICARLSQVLAADKQVQSHQRIIRRPEAIGVIQ